MNQNDWNQNNDSQNGQDEYRSPSEQQINTYRNSYSYQDPYTPPAVPQKREKRTGKVVLIALACLLAIALCFGAGMMGSMLLAGYMQRPNIDERIPLDTDPPTPMDDPDVPQDSAPTLPSENEDADKADPMATPTERLPLPEMTKQPSLGDVTYTGSAGDKAYATLAEAIDQVNETVVEIFTETTVNGGWLGNYVQSGAGSGVIVSEDGYIATNHHIVEGATSIMVRLTDGTVYEAQLVGTDVQTDVAVIWVDAEETVLSAAKLGCSADLIVGEHVFAIGNPLGSLGGTVTDGIISATARDITVNNQSMTLLQTNAAVNPGNSGGGLFNMAGELIGIVNAKSAQDDAEGLGFAIPVDTAYEVICELIEYGYVRGMVDSGLTLYDVTSSNIFSAMRYFSSTRTGVYVWESAYCEKLLYGDLIVSVDGVDVTSSAQVESVLQKHEVGDTLTVRVIRLVSSVKNGREYLIETEAEVELTLREYIPQDADIRFDTP